MFEWISENSQILNTAANFLMLAIWAVYLQLLWSSFRRERRPRLLITRGIRSDMDARCLVTNMSRDTVFIRSIIVRLETAQGELRFPVTELEDIQSSGGAKDIKQQTRQGPLESGAMRDIGSFSAIITHVLDYKGPDDPPGPHNNWDGLKCFTIYIIGVYGPDDVSIGAKRTYDVVHEEDGRQLSPRTIDAEQIRSRRERKQIEGMLEEDL
ncbi:hypothetical protein [Jiella marina]|uniref:hypothetical protein n=1 Tax=Jiella sp. LLJ827 TaxID=2917712 RepID=UPI002100AF07|nr:hypothetical protein [Jiella sp. LLJ827]MCQ0988421.1 hypothetical protein [Jiella sp. LLJ827]